MELPDVTLVLVTGIGYRTEESIKAINYSTKDIHFGAVKYIQDGSIVDIDSWNKFIIYELHKYVETGHCLLIHENGFVVHPESWNPEWLEYDFIGAPWPLPEDDVSYRTPSGDVVRVGNSVSLRSKRILQLPSTLNLEWKSYYGNTNEDGFLCVHNLDLLKQHGCNFAELEQAKYFSRELDIPENQDVDKPFCFHYNKFKTGRNKEFASLLGL